MTNPAEAQRKYCKEKGLPHFAPGSGICFSCRQNIYEHKATREMAGSSLITGCPFCLRSYCD